MNALPTWIDREAWNGYVEMRKMCKKPMTQRAEMLVVKSLFRLREEGMNPNAALDQSTLNNWTAVYPPRTERPNGTNGAKSFRERDAELAVTEAEKWGGGRVAAKRADASETIEMEPTHGRLGHD